MNTRVNRFIVPRPPGQPPGGRPAMRTGTGIFLIATGAILLFALSAGSPHWLNLQVVGVILILAGAAGLLLPRLARGRPARDRLRRWVRPGQPPDSGGAPDSGEAPAGSGIDSNGDRPAPVRYASVGDD
jgi:hypothetical protein